MPRLSVRALADQLRRLPPEELQAALRSRIVAAVNLPGLVLHTACGTAALRRARELGLGVIAYAETTDFLRAATAARGRILLDEATYGLARRWPAFSARWRLTAGQAMALLLGVCLVVLAGLLLPPALCVAMAATLSGLFFLAVMVLRLLCLLPPVTRPPPAMPRLTAAELPVYSVLVPLFRETAVLRQLLAALGDLRYPQDKLDIKLILEIGDVMMQRALAALQLPPHIEVIVVPAGLPQTKPRALNYALQFCRGELVTIYDAEDIPDPRQLLRAARRFAGAPPDLACLQAELAFYNPNENWLSRQFTVEYASLFGMLLPVLANHNLPLPLGGTSNHFRMEVLRSVGAWDPFNVTEDADLGVRLARLGYATGMLDSVTHEEAAMRLGNWLRQRARWLKGFLMTWLVHMREPALFMRDVGPSGFWTCQVLTIGVFASVLLHPLCMAATLAMWLFYPPPPPDAGVAFVLLSSLNLLVLVLGYGVSLAVARRALRQRGIGGWYGTLATLPFYWLLMSAAAWLALWQFAMSPFHWNKTEHGLTRVARFRRQRPRGTG